jgi:UDP-glucose 4-epimerase
MRILVTGSAGRVGRAIYVRLSRDHEVIGLDKSPSSTSDFIGNISDPVILRKALQGIDTVIHTAALHAPHVGLIVDSEFESINVRATRCLAECAAESGVNKVVFTSTTALYGVASTPDGKAGWVNEALEPQPETVYHKTKIAAEQYLETFSRQHSIPITVIRMSRCFPEPAPIMAAYRLHRGVDARDVADAHALAVESTLLGFRKYIISGVTPFKEEDTTELLNDAPSILKQRSPDLALAFARRGWALPTSIDRVYSSALAINELGWTPKFGFTEVLKMYDEQSSEVLHPKQVWHAKE